MAATKINYRIKLMAGNNVVLVEVDGKESEIFMPQIDQNGRITLLNIIPNRRCCQLAQKITGQIIMKQEKRTSLDVNDKENMRPLANSTALKREKSLAQNGGGGGDTFGSSAASLPTPEPFRRAVPVQRLQLGDDRVIDLPRGVKVMRLYHNRPDGTPIKVGRLITSSSSKSNVNSVTREDLHNMSNVSCSFRIPSTPIGGSRSGSGVVCSTPLNKQLRPPQHIDSSNSKWRKCKTPIRTYSKRGGVTKKTTSNSTAEFQKPSNFKPTYLVNPTQGTGPSHRIEVRKRKLVVDKKVRISSRALKRQQQQQPATNSLQKSVLGPSISFTSLQKRHKTPMSAFDLLTNSNRLQCMSNKLKELFRERCINKASSTYSKYKVLCNIPPLQEDEQVLELTQQYSCCNSSAEQMSRQGELANGLTNGPEKGAKLLNPFIRKVTVNTNPGTACQIINQPLKQQQQIPNINSGTLKQTTQPLHQKHKILNTKPKILNQNPQVLNLNLGTLRQYNKQQQQTNNAPVAHYVLKTD